MSTTVTHLAGPMIHFGTHQRQRCSWCGYVLVDHDLTRLAVVLPADGSEPASPPGWPFEALVEVTTDGGFRASGTVEPHLHADGTCIPPDNACMRVPPELTLAVEAQS